MTKRDIFSELVEGFHTLKSEREGKLTLRQVKLAAHPAPVLAPQDVLAVREKLNFFRTVLHGICGPIHAHWRTRSKAGPS